MNIQDILKNRPLPKEPVEIRIIKAYMQKTYNTEVVVTVKEHACIISVPSAALASTLRLELNNLIKHCALTKKILIRIS